MQTEGIVGISIIILLIAYVSCVGAKEAKKEGMSAAEAAQLKLPTLHQSSAYCPYKPLYNQQLPWLVKVGKEWFCYENQDGTGATFLQRQLNPFVPHCPVASGKNCVAPPCFSSKLLIVQPFVRPLPV